MSPALWPYIVSGVLLVLGLAIGIGSFGASAITNRFDTNDLASRPAIAGYQKVGFAIVFLFVYYWLIRVAGIPFASMIAIPVLSLLYGERRYLLVIALAITVPGILYLFFDRFANIPIPLGILDF